MHVLLHIRDGHDEEGDLLLQQLEGEVDVELAARVA
jgi:hypothetical protein